jgi:BirA family biotin operon repressor/biotin-[acetyl-CoA-carboxylase] ligase
MTPEAIRNRLHARVVGRRIVCAGTCASTNDLAWKASLEDVPEGTAFFAEEQTRGRGRFGRTWTAPKGKAVLCSVILRPGIEAARVPLLTAMGALAAADVVGDEARIRFPNDVMLEGRKIAGVLLEARYISGRPDVFVLGIGINVNAHPPGVGATSMGPEVSRVSVARALLEALDDWYGRLMGGHIREFRKAWRERSFALRKRVRVLSGGKTLSGVVEEVDPVDGIVLRLDSGHPRTIPSEQVEHLDIT